MSLQTRLEVLVGAIGADIKGLTNQFATIKPAVSLDGGATPTEAYTGSYTYPGISELFYAEDLTAATHTGGSGASADIPGTSGSFTVPAGGRPVYVDYGAYLRSSIVNGIAAITLVIDGVNVTNSVMAFTSATANQSASVSRRKKISNLSAGNHTCKLIIQSLSGTAVATALGNGGASTYLSIILI